MQQRIPKPTKTIEKTSIGENQPSVDSEMTTKNNYEALSTMDEKKDKENNATDANNKTEDPQSDKRGQSEAPKGLFFTVDGKEINWFSYLEDKLIVTHNF